MAKLKIDNLVSCQNSMIQENLVLESNLIKKSYLQSNVYQKTKINNSFRLVELSKQIEDNLVSLEQDLKQFSSYFEHYMNDYITVNKYLTNGSQSDVNSIPTLNLLKESFSLKENNLKKINITNLNLMVDYEKEFKKENKDE